MIKKLIISLFIAAAASVFAAAQNNAYSIEDTCYSYFSMGETLLENTSNNAFEMANEAMLKRAMEVKDEKARCLYYVQKLKRQCRLSRKIKDRTEANILVEKAREEALDVARQTGYMQYFFYSYELCQTYYVNTNQEIHAQKLLNEMMDVAVREGNEYGLWQSQRFISALYLSQNDILNARKHLLEVVRIYENTTDPTIRRQSLTRSCCELADTYTRGSDSSRVFYAKAEQYARLHSDTLRVNFHKAQLAAMDKDTEKYRQYRDYCMEDPDLPITISSGPTLLRCTDGILENKSLSALTPDFDLLGNRQMKIFLRDLAISQDREDVAAWLGTSIISTLYTDISRINMLKIEEMSAELQNNRLLTTIEAQQRKIKRLRIYLGILALLFAGAAAAGFCFYKKTQNTT